MINSVINTHYKLTKSISKPVHEKTCNYKNIEVKHANCTCYERWWHKQGFLAGGAI